MAAGAGAGRGEGGGGAALRDREVSAATWPSRCLPAAAPVDGELEDVRWFPAEVVREACDGPAASCGLRLPGRHALARSVLSSWASSSEASSSSSSSYSAFFASLFSSEAFPCVSRSLPESSSSGQGEETGGLFELFRVGRREDDGGGGGETALALRWLLSPSLPSSPSTSPTEDEIGEREGLARAVEREASAAGLSIEALGGGEILFGRRKRSGKGKGEEEEKEETGGSVPPEERRIVLRSSSSSSSSSSSKSSAASNLHEVCACLIRRAHPLAEVAME